MKFILRDDDINYHFQAEQLKKWYGGVVDLCPVSVCIPAFIKGHFFHWCDIFESHTPYDLNDWLSDNQVFPIGDNKELVEYLCSLLKEKKIAISMHGIAHRNEEVELGEVRGNFIRGAEFFTNKDYTRELGEAKRYLNELFGVEINSFSPPQNMINENGLKAVIANNLSLCADLINLKMVDRCVRAYGMCNTAKIYLNRLLTHDIYPYSIWHKTGFVFHKRLQPQLDLSSIIESFEFVYKKNGVFVLSTHSYGFDKPMTKYNMTMKEGLIKVLKYVREHNNVEFTTLHELFKI